jgi:hypothetical protein
LKTILSLCDYTGNWAKPYADAGYKTILVDLKYGQDVRLLEKPQEEIYGILAAPPCTVFSAAGARWKRTNEEMIEGLSIVDACLRIILACKPKFWALENPVGKLVRYLGKPTMYFQPYDYGDAYPKKTCLWGEFKIPVKTPVKPKGVRAGQPSEWYSKVGGKSEKTKAYRSMTPMGFANAFYKANQWQKKL